MRPAYYVVDSEHNLPVPAVVRPATQDDFLKTEHEH